MDIAVTVTKMIQISMDEYKDSHTTKIFHENTTIAHILSWARRIVPESTINSIRFSHVDND